MSPTVPRIDAHQHFWRIERADYGWLGPELVPLYRDFGPADLAPELARAGIARTVLVQAAPTVAETRFLLDLARSTDFVAGVVGWIDMDSGRALDELDELAADPLLVGIRPMVQDLADEAWIARPGHRGVFAALAERGLAFDTLVRPAHLPHLSAALERAPELRVIVDHGAKPRVPRGGGWSGFAAWERDLARVAEHPSTCVKLSGLVTEAEPGWGADDLAPYVDVLFEHFGPERVLWGSDWPVVRLAGGFAAWWTATNALLARRPAAEREAVLGGNARRAYRLPVAQGAEVEPT